MRKINENKRRILMETLELYKTRQTDDEKILRNLTDSLSGIPYRGSKTAKSWNYDTLIDLGSNATKFSTRVDYLN